MSQIEIKKPSIDEKEAVKKETVKEISNLKKEVEKEGKVKLLPDREVGKKREVNVLPDREVRKKKAANVLDQEVEKGPLTKKDAEAFVKRVKKEWLIQWELLHLKRLNIEWKLKSDY